MNTYTFMNKNAELFDVEMDRGQAEKIFNLRKHAQHLLPVFLQPKKGMGISRRDFNDWWSGRRIPASRGGVKELLWKLKNIGLDELAEKCLGLSLSDHYWIRPNSDVKWSEINFFENTFSEDIGELLITGHWNGGNLSSPDNTSDGVVKKRWKIIEGKRCLLKGSFSTVGISQPQPFREAFASKIAELLLKPFEGNFVVPYWLAWEEDLVYSVCENFVTVDTEYVSFNQINQAYKKPNNESHFNFCRKFFGEYAYVLDLTLLLDFITLNEDRHFGNFGIIRETNTGEFLRPAPIFDTGASLFFDSTHLNKSRLESKPFNKDFVKQVECVDRKIYYDSLCLVRDKYESIFYEVFEKSAEAEERKVKILSIIGKQLELLFDSSDYMGLTPSSVFGQK